MKTKARRSSTSLRLSSSIFGMVLVALIMMGKQVAAQSGDWNKTLLRKYCRSYNAMNEVIFLRNLNTTFSSLRRQLSNPRVYYANAQTTSNDEFVYSFAMCREYLSTSECLACFESAVNATKTCWIADGGNIIYDDCSLRYENFGQIFGDTKVILDNDATPTAVCGNELSSQPPTDFNKILQEFLSDIQVATPKTSNFYVASTRNVSTNNSTVYAIAQCVKNTSQSICQSCLNTAYNNIRGCLPSKDGRAIDFFCFMRYSETSFFKSNQTTNIIPFITQGSSREYGMIGGLCSIVGLFLLVLVLLLWYRQQKKSKTVREDESGLQGTQNYSYQELRLATHNFGEECTIGKGGFGEVFKGVWDCVQMNGALKGMYKPDIFRIARREINCAKHSSNTMYLLNSYCKHKNQANTNDGNVVAVKRLNVGSGKVKFEFDNEVKLIRNVQHRNLVRLLGWCIEGAELLLVFEYMAHGSLNNFLWGEKRGILNWEKRFNIILGVARGLAHLHNEFHVKIIHRDIKSDNILLDDDFQPKIADFGLARFQPEDQTHISTKLAGTLGYMAPDYATHGHLSEKVDTYSFGVVCLEIISGRRCTDENFSGPDTPHLLEHAWQLYEKGMHLELIDDAFCKEEYNEANVMKTIEIALMCTQSKACLRPTMSEVVLLLLSRQNMGVGQLVKPTSINSRRVFYRSAN